MGTPSEPPTEDGRSDRGARRPPPARLVHERRLHLAGGALLLVVLAALVGAAFGLGSAEEPVSAKSDAEPAGLSPKEEVEARLARESRLVDQTLRHSSYISDGEGTARKVALTFDDGPGAQTPQILSILDRFGAHATFFSLGSAVGEYPRQNRAELRAGNAVGNHTFNHPRLAYMPKAEQKLEIDSTTEALAAEDPAPPRLFRPPYGSFDATTLELLRKRKMLMVLWSIDATDFGGASADGIAERVLDEIEPGSIVLMHDGGGDRSPTVAALPKVLRGLEKKNLEPVTVPELLATNPPPRDQPPPTALDGMP